MSIKQTVYTLIGVVIIIIVFAFNNKSFSTTRGLDKSRINVLWENKSFHNSELADSVASLNPDKFVVNIEGPGAILKPSTGPNYNDLVVFLQRMRASGYTGKFVCKLETSKGDYENDWNGKGGLPTIDTTCSDSWKVYLTYFNEIQSKLPNDLKFSEVMIEPENNYFIKKDTAHIVLPKIKKFIQDKTVSLSTTSDWTIGWKYWGVDYYYVQMYDMCYIYPLLCGHNKYTPNRPAELINGMKIAMGNKNMLDADSIYFIFSYSPLDTNTQGKVISHAPMFGEIVDKDTSTQYIWTKKEFMEFNKMFKTVYPNQTNTGIWSYDDIYQKW